MTLCVIDGQQCQCQPDEGAPCTAGDSAAVQAALWAEIKRLQTELLSAREDVKKWQGLAEIARALANLKENSDRRAARLGLDA